MAQGFIASQGDRSTPGSGGQAIAAEDVGAEEFVCPGSGIVNINELGLYCDDHGNTGAVFRIGIYDDGGTDPGNFVGGSAELTAPASAGWVQDTGVNIDLTGGNTYWLAVFAGTSTMSTEGVDTTTGYLSIDAGSGIYPTWPDPFSKTVSLTRSLGIYAVYSVASGGDIPIFMHHYTKNICNT